MRAVYDVVARFRSMDYSDSVNTIAVEASDILDAATKAQQWLFDRHAEYGSVPDGWRIVRIEEVRRLQPVG